MWMHIKRPAPLRWLGVTLLMTAGAACAHGTQVDHGTSPDAPIILTVRNDNWYDMRVYELRENGSMGARLATVTGLSTARVRLRAYQATEGFIRVMLRPIGSSEFYVTNPVPVRPGTRVQLRVLNNLRLSYLHPLSN